MPINTDIQQQVFDLLSKASNLSFVSADLEAGTRIGLLLSPGQRVTAEVLSTLANNRAQVQISTERFNLELPMPVRVGQNLELTFVSAEPRATFAMARPGLPAPPVTLSDASRLLGLMVGQSQDLSPSLRSSLHSISTLLRSSPGEAGVLANLMDEALVYAPPRPVTPGSPSLTTAPGQPAQTTQTTVPGRTSPSPPQAGAPQPQAVPAPGSDQARLAAFETNASQILQHIARSSRFMLVEAANQPVTPLPLLPGQEVDGAVVGTLPDKRAFVSVAGSTLEMVIPRPVKTDDILRLTVIATQPRPLFALARPHTEMPQGTLSEAGRWLSVLEHNQGGVSNQQMFVLERLNTILKSLPPDSPAFIAIRDNAATYESAVRNRPAAVRGAVPATDMPAASVGGAPISVQTIPLQQGNGIILNDDMAKLLQALIKGNRLALLEALNQQSLPPTISPGQHLKGDVLYSLGAGRFMLQVAGQEVELALPKGISRGDRVNLFFITNEPSATFLLARFGRTGDARVSEVGRWLSGFIEAAATQTAPQATLGIMKSLLTEAPRDPALLGQMLQQGLRESGLFYESHLARWFGNDYPLKELLREPQGQLSQPGKQIAHQQPSPLLQTEELARATLRTGSLEVMEAMVRRVGGSQHHESSVDQRLLPVVHEQLTALQNGQVVFRGDLLPGQPMEWSVREREARRNKEGKQERSWDTALQIILPKLGGITAKIRLDGTQVAVEIRTDEESASQVLGAGRGKLAEQLEAAGLQPGEIGVKHGAP